MIDLYSWLMATAAMFLILIFVALMIISAQIKKLLSPKAETTPPVMRGIKEVF